MDKKKSLSSLLRILADRIDNNECNYNEIQDLEEMVCTSINPLITRDAATKLFGVNKTVLDNAVSRKLTSSERIRNVVLYPFNSIKRVLNK